MNIEEREQGLLRLVDDYREGECRRLIKAAREEAADLIARTFEQERARLHERVVDERAGARAKIQAARAERDTLERAGGERVNTRLLAMAWPRLVEALMRRWEDPDGRALWVLGALTNARRVLPVGSWLVHHAPDWPEAERRAAAEDLVGHLGAAPGMHPDERIRAGLVVECAGAVLDASLDGILSDRPRLEARLLALLAEESTP
jgi:hypothetical protein